MYIVLMSLVIVFQFVAIFFIIKWAQRYGYWRASIVIAATVQLTNRDGHYAALLEFEPVNVTDVLQNKSGLDLIKKVHAFNDAREARYQ